MGELEGTLRSGAPGPFLHTFNHFNPMVFRFTLAREELFGLMHPGVVICFTRGTKQDWRRVFPAGTSPHPDESESFESLFG